MIPIAIFFIQRYFLKRRSKTKNFLSIFCRLPPHPPPRKIRKVRKIFGFCPRESASAVEAHWFASPRNRSVRGSFKPPRAPRVRSQSGFCSKWVLTFSNKHHQNLAGAVAHLTNLNENIRHNFDQCS